MMVAEQFMDQRQHFTTSLNTDPDIAGSLDKLLLPDSRPPFPPLPADQRLQQMSSPGRHGQVSSWVC